MSTTNILDLNNRIDELEKNGGGGGSADSAKRSDIATEFSTETSYTAGNFVYYEGKLYQFNADHSAGTWDPTDVAEANVTDQIVSNASAIAGLTASDVAYDNTDSGLMATNVQGAVDEAVTNMGNMRMAKLWENSDPTQNMASGTEILINGADYDLFAYVCFLSSDNNKTVPLTLTPVNRDTYVCYADTNPKQRRFDYTTGKITAQAGYNGGTIDNSVIILYQIYGIKLL